MDEREVARLQEEVEKLLRGHRARRTTLSAEEFRASFRVVEKWAPQATADELRQFMTVHFLADEAMSESRNVGEPPAHWRLHSREVMAQFKRYQPYMLAMFGREKPFPLSLIAPAVEYFAVHQRPVGEPEWLHYPVVANSGGGDGGIRPQMTVVFPGYTRVEELNQEEAMNDRESVTVFDAPSLPPAQPLYRLAGRARDIADKTGISQSEAVGFLLADTDVVLPWIRAQICSLAWTGATGVTLTIGTTEVRPDEVRAAYEQVRADPSSGFKEPEPWLIEEVTPFPTYVRRPIPEKTAAMLAFVDKYKADEGLQRMTAADWDECNDSFGVEYAGTYEKYKTGETLRTAYAHRKRMATGRR